jgi:predicted amidohydrolase YtcJ
MSEKLSRGEFIAGSAALGAVLSAGLIGKANAANPAPDAIFRGGSVITMVPSTMDARALAISNGKIVAVGSEAEVMPHKTSATQVINLDGRTLLPGFIDPHQHTITGALVTALFTDVGYTKYKSRQAVLDAIRAEVAKKPPGGWVYAMNFDNLLQGGDLSMADLDAISTAHPIMVYYINMHTATGNSTAFKAAKISEDVGALAGGGHFGRDGNGKLDGMIYEEQALKPFLIGLTITPQVAGRATLDWLKMNAKAGNTTVHEAGVLVFGNLLQGYERVATDSPARASISLMYDSMAQADSYKKYGAPGAVATQVPGTLFSLYAIKIVGDGSNQVRTAAQTLPYLDTEEKGKPNYDAAQLLDMTKKVYEAGWPVSIHANGDATIDLALDAIEAAYGANPATGVNRIEHCTITRPDQIKRMAKLGVQPSFLMNHVYFYGAAYRDDLFGPERAGRMDSAADCVKAGLPFTIHTDAPCSNVGTLQLIQTAVTRVCNVDGSVVGADQAISIDEAIKAVTVNAAGQIGLHDRIGTLEVGKEADLVILDSNPYTVDPHKIMSIGVSETWVAGKKTLIN